MTYSKLFTIEMLHNYYITGTTPDFDIIPSVDCKQLLANHKMVCRNNGNQLMCAIKTDLINNLRTPSIPLILPSVFRFYLSLKNPSFLNFTNINLDDLKGKKLYFSNFSNNKVGSDLFLSLPISAYLNTESYFPGDLVSQTSGTTVTTYEAQKKSGPSTPTAHGTSVSSYWKTLGNNELVSSEDLIQVTAGNLDVNFPSATSVQIAVYSINPSASQYDRSFTFPASAPQSTHKIDITQLPPGKYQLQINGVLGSFIYLDPVMAGSNFFGVLEIFQHPLISPAFGLLNNDNSVKDILYKIRFGTRSTVWKYLPKTSKVTGISDHASVPLQGNLTQGYTSSTLIPFSEAPNTDFSLQHNTLGTITPLKNPDISQLKTITLSYETFYCSEIFLNY